MVHITRVPLSEISRAVVYENRGKLSLSKIVEKLKPDLAVTGVFYDKSWSAVCPAKAEGKALYVDRQWSYWALSWDTGPDMAPEVIPAGGSSVKANSAANTILITDGTPHQTLYYNSDVGGRRGRAAVALTNNGELLVFAASDGSASASTPEELRDYLSINQGCKFAIMMDGGRKVNCYDRAAKVLMEGEDPSQNLLLLWLTDNNTKEKEERSVFKLALGAGHHIYTAGKRCLKALDPNETREWWLNDRICDYVEDYLKDYEGYELLRLDDSDDGEDDVKLSTRTSNANRWGADFYLSVHHNAGINGGSGGGIVAYVHPNAGDAARAWQGELYDALIRHTGLKGNRSKPMAESNLQELRETAMPAVLLELGFMDSSTDVPIILTDEYARQCAEAIVEVLVRRGGLTRRTVPEKDPLYRVQLGAFSKKENAERLRAELSDKGYQTYMVRA